MEEITAERLDGNSAERVIPLAMIRLTDLATDADARCLSCEYRGGRVDRNTKRKSRRRQHTLQICSRCCRLDLCQAELEAGAAGPSESGSPACKVPRLRARRGAGGI